MEKLKRGLKWLNHLGIIYSTLLISLVAVGLSLLISTVIELLLYGQIQLLSLLEASITTLATVPLISFVFLYLIFKINEDKKQLGYFSSIDSVDPELHRAYLVKHAEHELARIQRYGGTAALLLIEVDGFLELTEQHGYFAGLELLDKLENSLLKLTRNTDLAGRFGGEGFFIFSPSTYCSGALNLAENIRRAIEQDYADTLLSVSIGIAICTCKTQDIDSALTTAEQLLTQAKNDGRNQVVIEKNCSKFCFCMESYDK